MIFLNLEITMIDEKEGDIYKVLSSDVDNFLKF